MSGGFKVVVTLVVCYALFCIFLGVYHPFGFEYKDPAVLAFELVTFLRSIYEKGLSHFQEIKGAYL